MVTLSKHLNHLFLCIKHCHDNTAFLNACVDPEFLLSISTCFFYKKVTDKFEIKKRNNEKGEEIEEEVGKQNTNKKKK